MTVRQLWNRLLAIALAAFPLGVSIWTAFGWLYSAHAMLSAETAETRSHLHRYEALLARQDELEAVVLRSRHRARNHYWSGSTEAEADETLRIQLQSVIETAGAEVQQIEAPNNIWTGEQRAVELRVTLHATATELLETLYAVENYRPYLFVEDLYIRPLERRARSEQMPTALLQASMRIRGYLDASDAAGAR